MTGFGTDELADLHAQGFKLIARHVIDLSEAVLDDQVGDHSDDQRQTLIGYGGGKNLSMMARQRRQVGAKAVSDAGHRRSERS